MNARTLDGPPSAMQSKRRRERLAFLGLRVLTYGIISFVALVVVDIVWNGIGTLSWEFLTSFPRRGGAEGGILPPIVGTLSLVALTIAFALPFGMAAAIYLSEYASQGRLVRAIRLAIVTLAGVP